MYNKARTKEPTDITLDYILTKVSEYDIYASYMGQFKVGMIYKSPFRKDRNPSFGVYYSKRANCLLFKDHGTGDCGNIIKFVSLVTGKTDYREILQDIVDRLNVTNITELSCTKQYIPPENTIIGIVRQRFTEEDKKFWAKYNISTKTLKKYHVDSIKYYLCNGIVKGIYRTENPIYAYKVYDHFKIYRPYADKYSKWRSNLTTYDIQGYEQLPKTGDLLVITKSLKDVMCLHEMGISAISPSSETTFIPETVIEQLKSRFKRLLILFDRDVCGVRQSRKISRKMALNAMFVHKRFKAKDISDAIKLNGFEIVKDWLLKELHVEDKKCNLT